MARFHKEHVPAEMLVLDLLSNHAKSYHYIVSFKKELYEATIPLDVLKKFGRNALQFGTILNGILNIDKTQKTIHVSSVKLIYLLPKAKSNKWAELKLDFSTNLKKHVIKCSALTNGCFTYMEREFTTPAVYNDVLGILADRKEDRVIPAREIGRLVCTVTTEQSPNGTYHLRVESVLSFEKVLSLAQSALVGGNEHFGLVTREECEVKRDLRLVSSRDFPRDVRIFRSGSHCCESIDIGQRRPHLHSECLNTCVGDVNLIGKCVAFKMKRCLGMTSPPDDVTQCHSEGRHVDSRELRDDVTQLEVHVHGGFVEVETIAEYSGYTDHCGLPLLWSHDVEFVVDISGIFVNLEKGLYTVKVVRFHRPNVFAKWRLARRNPIIKAMQTRYHSQGAHSINLATMGILDFHLTENGLNCVENNNNNNEKENDEEVPRQRLPSFSRFGTTAQSLCLPRTDSMDKVELFEFMVRNDSCSSSVTSSVRTTSTTISTANSLTVHSEDLLDNDDMWQHHDTSVLKIVDDDVPEDVTIHEGLDENSNVF